MKKSFKKIRRFKRKKIKSTKFRGGANKIPENIPFRWSNIPNRLERSSLRLSRSLRNMPQSLRHRAAIAHQTAQSYIQPRQKDPPPKYTNYHYNPPTFYYRGYQNNGSRSIKPPNYNNRFRQTPLSAPPEYNY